MLIDACRRWAALSGGRQDMDDPAPASSALAPNARLPAMLPPASAPALVSAAAAGGGVPPDDGAGVGLGRGDGLTAASTAAAGLGALRRAATVTGSTIFSALGSTASAATVAAAEEGDREAAAMAALMDSRDSAAVGKGHLVAWVQRRVRRPWARVVRVTDWLR